MGRERRWLNSEGALQVERGRSRRLGEAGRRTLVACPTTTAPPAPEGWKTWWMKTSERTDGWKDGRADGWRVEQLNRGGSYLPVWGVCACAESGADWRPAGKASCSNSWLLYSTHRGANWKWGRGLEWGGRRSFLRWSINTAVPHTDNPFHSLIQSPSRTRRPFKVTQSFTPSHAAFRSFPPFYCCHFFLRTAALSHHSPLMFTRPRRVFFALLILHSVRTVTSH